MMRTLQREALRNVFASLISKQIHGVAGVVPEQMVRPTARLAGRVHIGPSEEVRLHIHLLDLELAGLDALVDPLMARIKAPRMAGHDDQSGFFLRLQNALGIRER